MSFPLLASTQRHAVSPPSVSPLIVPLAGFRLLECRQDPHHRLHAASVGPHRRVPRARGAGQHCLHRFCMSFRPQHLSTSRTHDGDTDGDALAAVHDRQLRRRLENSHHVAASGTDPDGVGRVCRAPGARGVLLHVDDEAGQPRRSHGVHRGSCAGLRFHSPADLLLLLPCFRCRSMSPCHCRCSSVST